MEVLRRECVLVVHLEGVHAVILRLHLWHLLLGVELLHVHIWVRYLHCILGCRHGQRGTNAHAEAGSVKVSSMLAMVERVRSTGSGSVISGQLVSKDVEAVAVRVEQ